MCFHTFPPLPEADSESLGLAIFGTIVDDLLPSAVVTKSPLYRREMALIPLLVVFACLCRIMSAYYIVMSRGIVQFLPQYTSGFGLGEGSKYPLG